MRLASLTLSLSWSLASVAILWASPARAAAPKIMVVPVPGTAGALFETQVMKLMPAPLAEAGARVVPLAQAKAAFKKTQIKPIMLKVPSNAAIFGKVAGLDYILVVEGTGTRPRLAAVTTLLQVRNAKIVQSDRFALPGGKFTPAIAAQIANASVDRMSAGAPRVAEGKPSKNRGTFSPPKVAPVEGGDPTEPAPAASSAEEEQPVVPPGERGDKWRPGFSVRTGLTLLQRNGTINPKVANPDITPPCYCGTERNSNPYFPGFNLGVDLYPAAISGDGTSAIEGLGLKLDLFVTSVLTAIDQSTGKSVRSTLFSFKGAAAYRVVLWNSPLAVDLTPGIGFTMFNFPISEGPYPGVSYKAPYVDLNVHAPLGIKELQLVAGIGVMFGVKTGDKAATWLGTQGSGTGIMADAGLRFIYKNAWEFLVAWQLDYFSVPFTGTTNFPESAKPINRDTVTNLANVALRDMLNQFVLNAAYNF